MATFAPAQVRFGLSATAAQPDKLAQWLCGPGAPAKLLNAGLRAKPEVRIMPVAARMPYGGFLARYAVPDAGGLDTRDAALTPLIPVEQRRHVLTYGGKLWAVNPD